MTPYRAAAPVPPNALALGTPVTVTVCENPTAVAAAPEGDAFGRRGFPGGVGFPGDDFGDETYLVGPPPGDEGPPFIETPLRPPLGPPTETSGAVPEPATWAMMIVGFGAIGASLRRRRAQADGRRRS